MVFSLGEDDDGRRLNAAAVWYSRLRSEDAADSVWADFTDWLEADDANRAAFDAVEGLYADLDAAVPSPAAIEAVRPCNVVMLPTARRPRLSPVHIGMAALAASLALFIGIRMTLTGEDATRYATRAGETRTVSLADGTVIEMNTASTLSVAFDGRQRHVTLEQGEALFRVGKDPERPFLVSVGGRDVRDIGTVFNILRDHARLVVTVESGKVSVTPAGGAASAGIQLAAGEQLAATDGAAEAVNHVDPAQATSWRDGYLTYREVPLSIVVADLNRYFNNRIHLIDQDAGVRRFSGVLKVDDEDAVLNRLTQLLPLVADHESDGEVGLRLKRQGD